MAFYTSETMIQPYCAVWTKLKQKGSWKSYMKGPLVHIPVDILWLKRSYGQDIIGPPWKPTVISILGHVTSAKSMLIRCTYLQFL